MVMHVLVGGHGNVNQVGCKDAATKVATCLYLNYCIVGNLQGRKLFAERNIN